MALTDEDKAWISNTIAELLRPTNSRLDAIDHRLEAVDGAIDHRLEAVGARLDAIDRRLEAVDARFDAIDHRLEAVDARLDAIDHRLDSVDARFDRLDDYLLRFRSEVMVRFDVIDQRLDFLASSFSRLDVQVPPLNRAVVDFGILAGQFAREQMFTRERDADIAGRIARLEEQVSKPIKPAA